MGLDWDNVSWVVARFENKQPFIPTATDGRLVPVDIFDEGDFDTKFEHPLLLANCLEPEEVLTSVAITNRFQVLCNPALVPPVSF
mgnify:FL=1